MELFLRLDINLFSAAILVILLFNMVVGSDKHSKSNRVFFILTNLVLFLLMAESLSFWADRRSGNAMYILNYVSNLSLYLVPPFVIGQWAEYVERVLLGEISDLKRRRWIRGVPTAMIVVLVLLNFRTGILFQIGEGNRYERGPLYLHQTALNFVIGAQAYATLFYYRHRTEAVKIFSLAAFPLIPMVGVIIQTAFFGTPIIWSNMTLALLLIFLNVQKTQLLVDSLTGIQNRRGIEYFIDAMGNRRKEVLYGGMMMDLDNLKEINDHYGHHAGDKAIQSAAQIIKGALRRNDFVARYAGDEFFVIIEVESREVLEAAVERIRKAFSQFNLRDQEPWSVEVSIGYDVFWYESAESVDQAMRRIDDLMYQEKKKRKLERLAAESTSS